MVAGHVTSWQHRAKYNRRFSLKKPPNAHASARQRQWQAAASSPLCFQVPLYPARPGGVPAPGLWQLGRTLPGLLSAGRAESLRPGHGFRRPGLARRLTADELIERGRIQPLIMVGIYNTGVRRVSEYTPTRDPGSRKGGKADRYAQMLAREVKPFIDREYRTLKPAVAQRRSAGRRWAGSFR